MSNMPSNMDLNIDDIRFKPLLLCTKKCNNCGTMYDVTDLYPNFEYCLDCQTLKDLYGIFGRPTGSTS